MAKKKGLKISVVHRDSYYRAGLAITKAGIDVPIDALSKEQIAALKADTNLRVAEISIDDGAAAGDGGDGAGGSSDGSDPAGAGKGDKPRGGGAK